MSLIPNVGRKNIKFRLTIGLITGVLWLGVILHLFPVYWMITTSIKPYRELMTMPPTWFVREPTLYVWKLIFSPFHIADLTTGNWILVPLKNSLIITAGIIAIQIPVTALVAYTLSKLESPKWERIIFLFFIGTMLLPFEIALIPRYLLIQYFPFATRHPPSIPFTNTSFPTFNLLNTYWSVILPSAYSAFSVLLFKGHFDSVPDELINAARLDGASEIGIFTRIVLPISRPVIAVVSYFSFTTAWNQFMWPLIVLKDPNMRPLTVTMYKIQEKFIAQPVSEFAEQADVASLDVPLGWNLIMVTSIIQAIPVFIMFLIFREELMRGIKLRGFK